MNIKKTPYRDPARAQEALICSTAPVCCIIEREVDGENAYVLVEVFSEKEKGAYLPMA